MSETIHRADNIWMKDVERPLIPEKKDITFEWRDDYQREPIANNIIKLLTADVDISPMVIDGNWGTGKTEFCHKLIASLKISHPQHKSVYIDAFQAETADAPLMTLLAAVLNAMPEGEKRNQFLKRIKSTLKFFTVTVGKAGLGWALQQSTEKLSEDFDAAINKAGDELLDTVSEKVLKAHAECEQNIEALKDALRKAGQENSIIIFVDEIDRCKPNFALAMLEKIKHVFDVEGIQFVLITNFKQLHASVSHVYGGNLDSKRYLDKFLKFKITLPITFKKGNEHFYASAKHLEDILGNFPMYDNEAKAFLRAMIVNNDRSLREVENFCRYLEVYKLLSGKTFFAKNNLPFVSAVEIFGIYLSCFHIDIIQDIINGNIIIDSIVEAIGTRPVTVLINSKDAKYTYDELIILKIYSQLDPKMWIEVEKDSRIKMIVDNFSTHDMYGMDIIVIIKHVIHTLQLL